MQKIKKGDQVVVLAGKDKGKVGKVLSIKNSGTKRKVVVEGINLVCKTIKANPEREERGGFRQIEAAIALSNVALYNIETKKPDRVGFKFLENGDKVRYFKSNGVLVDIR